MALDTRTLNMEKRRKRILAEARRVIAEDGFEALNTRSLAKAAGVTAPTLYNLIGSKAEIVKALMLEAVERIEDRLTAFEDTDPLDMAEAVVIQSTDLFGQDENYYKAAVISGERLMPRNKTSATLIDERSIQMAQKACRAAIAQSLLRGNVCARSLGEQMYITYCGPFRQWAHGAIGLKEFRRQALRGFYMTLACDAVETFRELLLQKINDLETAHLEKAG